MLEPICFSAFVYNLFSPSFISSKSPLSDWMDLIWPQWIWLRTRKSLRWATWELNSHGRKYEIGINSCSSLTEKCILSIYKRCIHESNIINAEIQKLVIKPKMGWWDPKSPFSTFCYSVRLMLVRVSWSVCDRTCSTYSKICWFGNITLHFSWNTSHCYIWSMSSISLRLVNFYFVFLY